MGACCFTLEFEEEAKEFCLELEEETQGFGLCFSEAEQIHTDDYNDLINKPSINEVELKGNKTFEELGDRILSNAEIKAIFDRVFKGGQ